MEGMSILQLLHPLYHKLSGGRQAMQGRQGHITSVQQLSWVFHCRTTQQPSKNEINVQVIIYILWLAFSEGVVLSITWSSPHPKTSDNPHIWVKYSWSCFVNWSKGGIMPVFVPAFDDHEWIASCAQDQACARNRSHVEFIWEKVTSILLYREHSEITNYITKNIRKSFLCKCGWDRYFLGRFWASVNSVSPPFNLHWEGQHLD